MKKRGFTTNLLISLRKVGMLCKKPTQQKPRLRISHTITNNGEKISSEDFILAKKELYGIGYSNKDRKTCHYNYITQSCRCGLDIGKLKENQSCPLK